MSIKIKATTPCYKFINASPDDQLEKIREEVEEVAEAWATYSNDKTIANLRLLLMELTDVKACVNTAIAQIHKDVVKENIKRREERKNDFAPWFNFWSIKKSAKQAVIEKNLRRGYYIADGEEEEYE